jgi:hypothetical protein
MWTDVSEERISSTFRIENQPSKKTACSRCLTAQPPRYIPEDDNIRNYSNENRESYNAVS